MPPSVLIVCLGNVCRSPIGEAVLKKVAEKRGIDITVDSAGTAGYHVGKEPDSRASAACRNHNVPINHVARKIAIDDFYKFDYILAVDAPNLAALQRVNPKDSTAEVRLWGSYADGQAIADPYYDGPEGFEEVFKQCERYADAFLDAITTSEPSSA